VPGHLLVTACTSAPHTGMQRLVRALVALGISAPVVGLLALSTALLPGGFLASSIVAVVSGACVMLAGAAVVRRRVTVALPTDAEGEAVAA